LHARADHPARGSKWTDTFLEGGAHISCVKSCMLAQGEEKPSNAACKILSSVVQRDFHHGPDFASLKEKHFSAGCKQVLTASLSWTPLSFSMCYVSRRYLN